MARREGRAPFAKGFSRLRAGRKDVPPAGDFLIAQKVTKDAHRKQVPRKGRSLKGSVLLRNQTKIPGVNGITPGFFS